MSTSFSIASLTRRSGDGAIGAVAQRSERAAYIRDVGGPNPPGPTHARRMGAGRATYSDLGVTSGGHFLQIPGPTNVRERVLRAMDRPVPDHRGPEMPSLVAEIRSGLRSVFKSEQGEPVIFPGSGTGAWEASIVNTLSPGERVLSFENGHFARLYAEAAGQLGMRVDDVKLRWGDAVTRSDIEANLKPEHRAVLIVHNETSTGVTTDLGAVRRGIDQTGLDPLLLVDVVSSLGSIDFRMDEWRVAVAPPRTQKGLLLPPGGAVLFVWPPALEAAERGRTPRYFYDWRPVIRD